MSTQRERFQALKTRAVRLRAVRDSQVVELAERQTVLARARQRIEDLSKAREVIMLVGKNTQQALQVRISTIVSLALATVFEDPYEFKVRFEERRNTVECDLLLVRGEDEFSPLDSVGGGVVDVVSFALRIADWKLRGGRPVIILDEQFRNVWPAGQPKVSALLQRLSAELELQIILVSHQERVNECADKTFYVENGRVTELAA